MKMKMADVKDLVGQVLISVENKENAQLIFVTDSGKRYSMHHEQDCCENVNIESIVGDLSDLIGTPVLIAEESTNSKNHPIGYEPNPYDEYYTWTFYKFATKKGYVDIRWYGESNGYYSEEVVFKLITE